LRGEISKLKKELKQMGVDEWAGEITIQKELKEIKDLLTTLNETVTKLKRAIGAAAPIIIRENNVSEVQEDRGKSNYWDGLEEG
jgi:hypothetical protein